jgi:hypothetical protein
VIVFIAGVADSERVIKAVKAGQADATTALHQDIAAIHDRIQALEVTTATRITSVENSIKAKLP